MARQPRRMAGGTTAQVAAYTGPTRELVINTDNWRPHVQNGVAAGGVPISLKSELDAAVSSLTALISASAVALPPGWIFGLTMSNNTSDAVNDIDIAVGRARDVANTADLILATAITKRLDAGWAVGNNQGGLDTGTLANGWYHLHLIKRIDTNVVDVLFSLSATAPTLPTNYTKSRRIGSILRVGGAIKAFSQSGNQFLWKAAVLDLTGAVPGAGAYYTLPSVPTGLQVDAVVSAVFVGNALSYQKLRSPDMTASAASASDFDAASTSTSTVSSIQAERRTDVSARLWGAASSGGTGMEITTLGWNDPL